MKPLKEVAHSYMALGEAQKRLEDREYSLAAEAAVKAMKISSGMPPGETFDHDGFDALCYAVLASAQAGQGLYDDCLVSADRALRYFQSRGELQQEEGKQWISVMFSRGVSLHELGRKKDALQALETAGEMIAERKGELPGRERMLEEIERRVSGLGEDSSSSRTSGYKAWWEFWS
ncbi:MAG TPA: DUF3856 domain-containing protein [Prosthecochloris aestuarii]|uniref:DUF3856 domain-containing protein n=1 Tax=Prosthecochloris aestuarii TaxID=1102 RepID=A0A831ST83_PROAE|nr:DUF3856 domain-containing protein [Prosthecochloris sp.]HED31698.1 DUF3856 domain-containing protein [Prosthecochloris aestuarii]